ncbi:hypothetical protein FACS189421_02540 [Bacteroidia bacterium]|nr:hypothetical protein FACS189421_02540 [Bacteroidia bacterium]
MLKKIFAVMLTAVCAQSALAADYTAYFRFDTAIIGRSATAVLEAMSRDIRFPECTRIQLIGHACDLGDSPYNMDLGQMRADAMKEQLILRGFNPDNIEFKSVGDTDPIVPNDTEEHRKLNRSLEVIILPRESWYRDFKCNQELRDLKD